MNNVIFAISKHFDDIAVRHSRNATPRQAAIIALKCDTDKKRLIKAFKTALVYNRIHIDMILEE